MRPVLYVVVLGPAFGHTESATRKHSTTTTTSTVQVTVSVLVGTRHESVKDCEMRYTPDHIGVSPSLVTYHVTRDGRSFFFLVININVTSTTTYWKLRKADLGRLGLKRLFIFHIHHGTKLETESSISFRMFLSGYNPTVSAIVLRVVSQYSISTMPYWLVQFVPNFSIYRRVVVV